MSRPSSKIHAMPPLSRRPASSFRAHTATPSLAGRLSLAESLASTTRIQSPVSSIAGMKRKERDYDSNVGDGETNIKVVVRCRGRSEREVREHSGVVVSTDGVKGKTVELSMGPSPLSNKTYCFDKVFSPAADQFMIFNDIVVPILDDVLRGFNCTIFAYGQTGTGKTYTMSGDISDQYPLSDKAGIIPRVLHELFAKLDSLQNSPASSATPENSVKVSFIELYNEELRELLPVDDSRKLKIFDGNSKKGHIATLVQGMGESHITSASEGIQLLQKGSDKRQVMGTKYNNFSSRSHTIFTVTVKRTTESGEEFVSGKLNLVDLAGSENIQRSGAENKRAAEAGLINKSLLTLGRVINALVDKSKHIPYRESKLTRLLQDSLGGGTETCILATLSPARSNLEETISTLDYAFRAKNVRNKPQVNQIIPKQTLLKEFIAEIEDLKTNLSATRQRNGIYLAPKKYDEITTESNSRRILVEEQRDRIRTLEDNLRDKDRELFALTTDFSSLKKESEMTRLALNNTGEEITVLEHTKRSLEEELYILRQQEKTEDQYAHLEQDPISTLGQTTVDTGGLHSKPRRRRDLHSANRQHCSDAQIQVSQVTALVERRLQEFQEEQRAYDTSLSSVFSEDVTNPGILPPVQMELDLGVTKVVDLTGVEGIIQQNHHSGKATRNDLAYAGNGIASAGANIQQEEELAPVTSVSPGAAMQDHNTKDALVGGINKAQSNAIHDALIKHGGREYSARDKKSKLDRPPAIDPDDGQWAVERLIKKRRTGRKTQYLVKWLGYPDSDNTWVIKRHIGSEILKAFEAEELLANRRV